MFQYSIYKITCNNPLVTDVYVGSTTNLKTRQSAHKSKSVKPAYINKVKLYECISNNGGWSNWTMALIELFDCECKKDAQKRERFYCDELKSSLNMRIPSRTQEQYYQDHKERIIKRVTNNTNKYKDKYREYAKQYRELHKDKITCSCGGCYTMINKSTHYRSYKHINFINSLDLAVHKAVTQTV
jgi:hypothetical protein